jgi:arsenate reductase-like glutaredoxin family protein
LEKTLSCYAGDFKAIKTLGYNDTFIKGAEMNIQIFGSNKCFDSKKAMRYFKERGIKYQFIDMKEKGMSKGEYESVKQAVGGLDYMLDEKSKHTDILMLIKYLSDEDKDLKILENQKILKTPIVRNGKQATVGFCPDIWKGWN